jgi:hypothetical protein
MSGLNIIQYNCGNANGRAARPFLDSINPDMFPVIAIQEPMVMENQRGGTYCPRNFRLSRQLKQGTRVVFFIHNQIPRTDCEVLEATDYCEKIQLRVGGLVLHLINVYSPPSRTEAARIEAWPDLARMLQPPLLRTLVIGDFNAHHDKWAGATVAREPRANHLWLNMSVRNFQLLNERGVTTWRRGPQEAVLDLGFATRDMVDQVMAYRPRDDWALTKDHIPIEIQIDVEPPRKPTPKGFALFKATRDYITDDVNQSEWAANREGNALTNLVNEVKKAMEKHCPKRTASSRARPEWSPVAAELLQEVKQARRNFHSTRTEEGDREWKRLKNQLKRELRSNCRTAELGGGN